jgi:hypothetical protein
MAMGLWAPQNAENFLIGSLRITELDGVNWNLDSALFYQEATFLKIIPCDYSFRRKSSGSSSRASLHSIPLSVITVCEYHSH